MDSRTFNIFSDGSIKSDATPTTDLIRYRVKTDRESPFRGFKPRTDHGVPAVAPVSFDPEHWPDTSRCDLTEPWQYVWADCLSLAKYKKPFRDLRGAQRNYIASKFAGLTGGDKFMTDHFGSDTCDDYINKHFTGHAMRQESKVMADRFVYSRWPTVVNSKGVRMVRLLSFDVRGPLPASDLSVLSHPCVIQAVITYPNKPYTRPFTQLGAGVPVFCPFITNGPAWMPLVELERA